MTRRDTIIISVLINIGLLTILFATAMTGEGEIAQDNNAEATVNVATVPTTEPEPDTQLALRRFRQQANEEVAETPSPEETPVEQEKPETTPEKKFLHLVVKRGDTLKKIAQSHGLTIESIVKANGLRSPTLQMGQVLKIPVVTSQQEVAAQETLRDAIQQPTRRAPEYYIVKAGDNPWLIAKNNGVPLEDLLRLNGLDDKKARQIRPGDSLRIR